jgi:glycosyltransferase involved in cell wall biosynthesis
MNTEEDRRSRCEWRAYAFFMGSGIDGVNVVGYHRQSLGLGSEVRRIVRCLRAAGIPVATIDAPGSSSAVLHEAPESDNDWKFDTTLSVVAGDQLFGCMERLGISQFETGRHFSMWYWELMKINEPMKLVLPAVDGLVAGSEFIYECLVRSTDKPVFQFPLTNIGIIEATHSRKKLGLPEDRLIFLCTFDFFSVIERKNPLDAIAAFKMAFVENSGPLLLVKSQNGHLLPADLALVTEAIEGRADIIHVDQHVSEEEQASYLQCADVLVSLHRSEGLGLHILEALFRGVPILSTGFSAPIEFIDAENSLLVDYALVPVKNGNGVYPTGYLWAQPDVQHAAHLMRELSGNSSHLENLKNGTSKVEKHIVSESEAGTRLASWLLR